jgi:hypothetical protein
MKVFRATEALTDQTGTNHATIQRYKASIGLLPEQQLT